MPVREPRTPQRSPSSQAPNALERCQPVVVPVGGANFGSLRRACERIGVTAEFSADPDRIRAASHVILPGVGAAGAAMRQLHALGLVDVLRELRQPVLGICLGMQLLFEHSEEGDCDLLGLLPGRVERLSPAPTWPHMGWNRVDAVVSGHSLLRGIGSEDWFYFVHGYAVGVGGDTVASTRFGSAFTAIAARGPVAGVQFHPEKSAGAGRRLLRNFLGR